MDFNSTIDLIIKDLNEARKIIDDLKKYSGVPALQVELAKSKCKSAAEVISLLKGMSDNTPVVIEEKIPSLQQKPAFAQGEIMTASGTSQSQLSPAEKKKERSESAIIADKFSHLSNSFNEHLGSLKTEDDVSEILKTKPLSSLSEAIGVNDKFLFMREIFNNNKDAYNQAITRLDNVESLDDARAVIMSYTGNNNENEAIKQLLDLVKRKLP